MPLRVLKVPVDCQTQRELLFLYVVKNNGPVLLEEIGSIEFL